MDLLLDTHVFLWGSLEPQRLGLKTREMISSDLCQTYLSSFSVLEVAQLAWVGKLQSLPFPLRKWMDDSLQYLSGTILPLTSEIAMESYALPEPFHRDPADRILVATARLHQLTLLTADERILNYSHLNTVDART